MKFSEQTFELVNPQGRHLHVVYRAVSASKGLAVVVHGWNDHSDSPLMTTISQGFTDNDYSVLIWDASGSAGKSGGEAGKANLDSYRTDMNTVMAWAAEQAWYVEPFILCGHSMGGGIAARYAYAHPERVSRLFLISTMVAGRLNLSKRPFHQRLSAHAAVRLPAMTHRQRRRKRWLQDFLDFDVRRMSDRLTMPIHVIVGEHDQHTTVPHHRLLVASLPTAGKLEVVPGTGHVFRSEEAQAALREFIQRSLRD